MKRFDTMPYSVNGGVGGSWKRACSASKRTTRDESCPNASAAPAEGAEASESARASAHVVVLAAGGRLTAACSCLRGGGSRQASVVACHGRAIVTAKHDAKCHKALGRVGPCRPVAI